jgi:hypothetical protein
MLAKCCNPDCGKPFDYRQGRLVRVCRNTLDNTPSAKEETVIEHFWLCGNCSGRYQVRQESGIIRMKPRVSDSTSQEIPSF